MKMTLVDVKNNTYIGSRKKVMIKMLNWRSMIYVRISNYKNIFAKGFTTNWSNQIFVIKNLQILCHGHMLLMILMVKILLECFIKKKCKEHIKTICQIERLQ